MKLLVLVSIALSALPAVWAQGKIWDQCGGKTWTGSTSCVSGATCVYSNEYYSQCIPSTAAPSATTTSTSRSSSSSIPGTGSSTSSAPATSGTSGTKYWFSFGDSYTATGFSVTGTQPSTSNPFGNPAYPGTNTCGNNAPNWINYAATTLNTTFVKVYNHAYSGAVIDTKLVAGFGSGIKSLTDQTNDFLNYEVQGKAYYPGWTAADSLFSVWIGINDIGSTYSNSGSRPAFNTQLLNRYFELVTSMYNAGARNFLFLTVPPVDRSPLMLGNSASARSAEKTVILDYNSQLKTLAASFASSHPDVTYQVYDTQTIFTTVLDRPSSYGLKDATSYGSGSDVAWCNTYHPSPAFHLQIAKDLAPLIKGKYI
ncbi:carbohydrate esterase family 16 protein [Serendipita vermifera MAFF 305830]|uniref:Carbohydrate esterase family 16 protein n=1 Tax=Serendipita vermifera MAFF 305830 TaxID=933852 RepID=A0A0C2X432_SERVB|nr:carbohydrate esterase family 16 protein [Serendipita vermifera MAFF 305830]